MFNILTLDAPSLVGTLRTGYFRRAHLRIAVAASLPELLERAAVLRPEVIILVAGLTDRRGERGVARDLRALLAERRGMLLLAVPHERRELSEDLRYYDGILSLEEPELDLARALAPLMSLSKRRQPRMRVRIPAEVCAADDAPIDGMVLDLSAAGAGIHLPCTPGSDPYHVIFRRPDGRRVMLGARSAWADTFSPSAVRIGVRFVGATLDAVRSLYDLAFWEVVQEPEGAVIHLHGDISETTALHPLLAVLERAPTLDLGDVTRVNSTGVLRWVDFLQRIPASVDLHLRHVSVALGRQMLLVPAMLRRCVIESFFAPYECEDCDLDLVELITPGRALFPPACPACADPMIIAEPLLGLAECSRHPLHSAVR